MKETTTELLPVESTAVALRSETAVAPRHVHSPIDILEAAIRGGVTAENVAVVKELVSMCREQKTEDAKAAFARAFFNLRKTAPNIYADKAVKDNSGNVSFTYCTPEELDKVLEPLLLDNGFCTMAGQTMDDKGNVTVSLTLIHESGHQETREFTVRSITPNRMMDGAKCDTGATTMALRHLKIKMLGLKTRIKQEDDPRNLGGFITDQQAAELERRLNLAGGDKSKFLKLAGAKSFKEIHSNKFGVLDAQLSMKERAGR